MLDRPLIKLGWQPCGAEPEGLVGSTRDSADAARAQSWCCDDTGMVLALVACAHEPAESSRPTPVVQLQPSWLKWHSPPSPSWLPAAPEHAGRHGACGGRACAVRCARAVHAGRAGRAQGTVARSSQSMLQLVMQDTPLRSSSTESSSCQRRRGSGCRGSHQNATSCMQEIMPASRALQRRVLVLCAAVAGAAAGRPGITMRPGHSASRGSKHRPSSSPSPASAAAS